MSSLISSIAHAIATYPDWMQISLQRNWTRLSERLPAVLEVKTASENFASDLIKVWACSDYVADSCVMQPQWILEWAVEPSFLQHRVTASDLRARLELLTAEVADEAQLMTALRQFRRAEQVRLIWRGVTGLSDYYQTVAEISALADVCINVALEHLYRWLVQRHGTPMSVDVKGQPAQAQTMLVLGMGKLGASELNLSSDVDLIFAYPQGGETDHPDKPIDNQQFFIKLGQRLINALDTMTADGFVYRVDMRLRPYGGSGALALSFASFEDYYQNQGREWERYAMIKSRVVAGDANFAEQLLGIIKPFVYRRYADFSSIQALRDMKKLILSEVHRKGGEQNIKLGSGGIREVEFIVQACQLIYGGRDSSLQLTGLMPMLNQLQRLELLPSEWIVDLREAYVFLRNLEHALQGVADRQTQTLPTQPNEQQRIAWAMGFADWAELLLVLQQHRSAVDRVFREFLQDGDEKTASQQDDQQLQWLSLWRRFDERDAWLDALSAAGFSEAPACYDALNELRDSRLFGSMSSDAVQRFERFMPLLFQVVRECKSPARTLQRVLSLVRVILGRTVYLVLLYENPHALRQLCKLCDESPWIAEHLAKTPVILDELVDVRNLYHLPKRTELQDELRQWLLRIPEDDLEAQMDALRTFKQSHMLRVAASELGGQLPLMKVSDYLTWLAEAILAEALNIAWRQMVSKHGVPEGVAEGSGVEGFAIIAYGKLGGIELSYSSDLDMVFLYDADDYGSTDGERPLNNQVFFTRLGQKLIHLLSTRTTQGELYEVDMRLRPSGNSGMLVSSVAAFEKYQQQDAWTWEHQALVRTRFIGGDEKVGVRFEQVRAAILGRIRDEQVLRKDVCDMRQKMRQAAIEKYKGEAKANNHVKQGRGGLVDIEFITQFGALNFAATHPDLLLWSDNIRLLEVLQKDKCFDPEDMAFLRDAYRELRAALHRKTLAGDEYAPQLSDFPATSDRVAAIWNKIFHES